MILYDYLERAGEKAVVDHGGLMTTKKSSVMKDNVLA
jgi:hypothetical protein